MRILVVEDEVDLNEVIKKRLEMEHYSVDSCYDGKSALDYLMLAEYDGVIMDVMLPKMDGLEVLGRIRKADIQTPVMFLTAKDATSDIVKGLDCGADDYLVKPFEFPELLARVRVLVRKRTLVKENRYKCGSLIVDVNEKTVKRGDQWIELSPKEFAILLYLVRNQNIVLTREQIEANCWDFQSDNASNVVDVYIRYLRKKIDDTFEQKMIQTIRGAGYMLKCDE